MSTPQFSARVVLPGEHEAISDAAAGVVLPVNDHNATVPEDAPLPAQEFVNAAVAALADATLDEDGAFVLPNPNTGNAAVGDVRSGKTFSSATLTNATGTLVVV